MAKNLVPYLKAHRWSIAWALLQVVLIAGFELLKPWPLQIIIEGCGRILSPHGAAQARNDDQGGEKML